MPTGPLARYRALLASGALKPDADQARVAAALDALYQKLKFTRPARRTFASFFGVRDAHDAPKGLYIHGAVGRGKSLLMDMFYASVPGARKRRVHFNAFMLQTHQRIHEWRNLGAGERNKRVEFVKDAGDDPIAPIAKRIARESPLLCFDEFQVTDVADAMILGRLFEKLFVYGTTIVLTSNTPPERLYEGGINRQLFQPFIALIEQRMTVLELNGGKDYRRARMAGLPVYSTPLNAESDAAMDAAWASLTGSAMGAPIDIESFGRVLHVPRAAHGVVRFSFAELCGQPLGASDYVVLARHFHTFLVDHIPRLSAEQSNEARRFTLLIDTLYDEKAKFICSAAVPPDALVPPGPETQWYQRTASRLVEMQSDEYLRLVPSAHDAESAPAT